jgi:uncharacterized protein YdaU (DUF1376 family)
MAASYFVKYYPSDWIAGTRTVLTLEEEGLYSRAFAYMHDTGDPLPDDDRKAAKLLNVQILKYIKNMEALIAKGKMVRGQGYVFNERVMRDLQEFRIGHSGNSERVRKSWDVRRDRLAKRTAIAEAVETIKSDATQTATPHLTPHLTPPVSPGVSPLPPPPVLSEKPNVINGRAMNHQSTVNDNLEARSQKQEKETPFSPLGGRSGAAFWASTNKVEGAYDPDADFQYIDGKVVMLNGTKAEWIAKFEGDETLLDNILLDVSAYVQPYSGRPLRVQVEGQLGRRLAAKIQGDKRYQEAAKRNAEKAAKPAKPTFRRY